MAASTLILGFGVVGRAVTETLLARGDNVCIAQRNRPVDLPQTASFKHCDVCNADEVLNAVEGAQQVVLAIGLPYDRRVWREVWPTAMTNVVEACAAIGAKLVFVDNLYQLGPQTEPRREDMTLTTQGAKPAILTKVTGIWMAAAKAGRVRVAALRCSDFYGPDVVMSHLGSTAFGPLVKGKAAVILTPPDIPHDFAYVPDIARAVITLLDAPDDAYGQVWNMPCAPTRTPREMLQIGAETLNVKLKITTIPLWLLPVLGVGWTFAREIADVSFTLDRPYVVDASKFTQRFWSDVTSIEAGVAATARSFARAAVKTALPSGPKLTAAAPPVSRAA